MRPGIVQWPVALMFPANRAETSVSALSGSFVYSLPVEDSDRHTSISKTRAKSFLAENRPTRALIDGHLLTRLFKENKVLSIFAG